MSQTTTRSASPHSSPTNSISNHSDEESASVCVDDKRRGNTHRTGLMTAIRDHIHPLFPKRITLPFRNPSPKFLPLVHNTKSSSSTTGKRPLSRCRSVVFLCLTLPALFVFLCLSSDVFATPWRWVRHVARPFLPGTYDVISSAKRTVNHAATPLDMSAEDACAAHGWAVAGTPLPRVYDVTLFNVEFDLLELRMHELGGVVDRFVVVESNVTFSGLHKPRSLHNIVRDLQAGGDGAAHAGGRDMRWLNKFLPKLYIHAVTGAVKQTPTAKAAAGGKFNSWANQGDAREAHKPAVIAAGAGPGDLVITSDFDEIPRATAVRVLRDCMAWGEYSSIRLQMRFYYYSFEWRIPGNGWNVASVNKLPADLGSVGPTISGRSDRGAQYILMDSGWHCSWCFPKLGDFLKKLESNSHQEYNNPENKDLSAIQTAVCTGQDLFGRLTEAHSLRELLELGDGTFLRERSLVGAPEYLVRHGLKRFPFLLPNHCRRSDGPAV